VKSRKRLLWGLVAIGLGLIPFYSAHFVEAVTGTQAGSDAHFQAMLVWFGLTGALSGVLARYWACLAGLGSLFIRTIQLGDGAVDGLFVLFAAFSTLSFITCAALSALVTSAISKNDGSIPQ